LRVFLLSSCFLTLSVRSRPLWSLPGEKLFQCPPLPLFSCYPPYGRLSIFLSLPFFFVDIIPTSHTFLFPSVLACPILGLPYDNLTTAEEGKFFSLPLLILPSPLPLLPPLQSIPSKISFPVLHPPIGTYRRSLLKLPFLYGEVFSASIRFFED